MKIARLRGLLVGVAAVVLLSSCFNNAGTGGSSTDAAGKLKDKPTYKGTLSILTKFGHEQLSPYFTDLAKKYESMHPGVKVALDQQTDDSVKGKTKALVASNSLPDIYFSWTGNWGENFVRGNRAVDLSSVVAPDTTWGRTLSKSALDAFRYNGKYYGVPLYLDGKFMGYDKKTFAKHGIQPPKTFDQLLQDCRTIRKSGETPIALGNKESWPVLHYLGQLFAYNVPRATLERDFEPKTAKYTDPGYAKSLNELKQLTTSCTANGTTVNGLSYENALQQGSDTKAAMYYQEILEFDESAAKGTALRKDGFGFFRLPPPGDAKGTADAVEGAPEGYMINSASKQIPLALDFLKFVTSQTNAKTLSAPPYGQPSAVVGAVTPKTSSGPVVSGVKQINATPFLMPWLDTANVPDVAQVWLSGLQAFVAGSMTADQLVTKVRQAAEAAK
jgi:raffinose/stachyose/melibiose transport system substrate-binding protein